MPNKVPPDSRQAQEAVKPVLNRKLPNGTIIGKDGFLGLGSGELTVKNGLATDAAAKLIDKHTNKCAAYFYISAGSDFTLRGITDGNYRLIFGVGEDWDSSRDFFTRHEDCSEFDKPMNFATSEEKRGEANYEVYSAMEITLHPVLDGNARTHKISAEDFMRYLPSGTSGDH